MQRVILVFTIRQSVAVCFTPVADVSSLTARGETIKQQIPLNNLRNPELHQCWLKVPEVPTSALSNCISGFSSVPGQWSAPTLQT